MFKNARRGLLLLSLVGFVALIAAAPASAHLVDVVGGKTKLALNKKLKKKLAKRDIKVKGTKLTVTRGVFSFHALDDGGGGGIAHKGSLRFRSPDAATRVSGLRLVIPPLGDDSPIPEAAGADAVPRPLVARFQGEDILFGTLGVRRYKVADDHPGFSGLAVRLSKKGARVINKALGVRVLRKGTKLGELTNRSQVKERDHDDHGGH